MRYGKWYNCIQDVRVFRSAVISSDHFLAVAEMKRQQQSQTSIRRKKSEEVRKLPAPPTQ